MVKKSPVENLIERADKILFDDNDSIEDWRDAADMYKIAAELGSAEAFSRLSYMFYSGRHFRKDLSKALSNSKKAFSLGRVSELGPLTYIYIDLLESENLNKIARIYSDRQKEVFAAEFVKWIVTAFNYSSRKSVYFDSSIVQKNARAIEGYLEHTHSIVLPVLVPPFHESIKKFLYVDCLEFYDLYTASVGEELEIPYLKSLSEERKNAQKQKRELDRFTDKVVSKVFGPPKK